MTQQTSDGYGIYRDGYQPLLSSNQGRSSFCCRIFVRRYKERSKRIDVVSRLVSQININLNCKQSYYTKNTNFIEKLENFVKDLHIKKPFLGIPNRIRFFQCGKNGLE